MTTLETPRLVLRRARIGDVDDMHRVLGDEAAMTYWSTPPHSSRAETEAWIQSMIQSPREVSDDFVIEYQGKVIGKMGAWRLPEFGFILAPEYWGQGLASEALTIFIRHIFQRPDVSLLRADVDPRNTSSLNLLRRHGFTQSGSARNTWMTHIGACDSLYLELKRSGAPTADPSTP